MKAKQKKKTAAISEAWTPRIFPRVFVQPYADSLVACLRGVPGVKRVAVAGDYRRATETLDRLDLLAAVEQDTRAMEVFLSLDLVEEVLSRGAAAATVILDSGLRVDLHLVSEEGFGMALISLTGSAAHKAALHARIQRRGLDADESGVYRKGVRQAAQTEDEVYALVGLAYIPPEIREDNGEIEAAAEGRLPRLIEACDIRGDLHVHTAWSDGRCSIETMALTAHSLGYEYMAITEHSQRLAVIGGMDEKRLREQMERIDRINENLTDFTILKGIEVDILQDGSLDLPDSVLGELDLVIGSIHHRIDLPEKKQTERIMRAMDHPFFTMLAHPTGRLLLERDPYEVDIPRLIRHARERGCFLELNAHPLRLDLNDAYCRLAKAEGVLVSIDTDAHSPGDLSHTHFGVSQARRGWLTKSHVLNTRTLRQLQTLLAQTRG